MVDLLDESERRIDADALAGSDREVHAIGDCVAARQAPAAIYEGRKLGLSR